MSTPFKWFRIGDLQYFTVIKLDPIWIESQERQYTMKQPHPLNLLDKASHAALQHVTALSESEAGQDINTTLGWSLRLRCLLLEMVKPCETSQWVCTRVIGDVSSYITYRFVWYIWYICYIFLSICVIIHYGAATSCINDVPNQKHKRFIPVTFQRNFCLRVLAFVFFWKWNVLTTRVSWATGSRYIWETLNLVWLMYFT